MHRRLPCPLILVASTLLIAACGGPDTAPAATTTSIPASPVPLAGIWQPAPGSSWQWQLADQPIDQSYLVDMYDIDLFENDARVVDHLHAQGSKVVCYISAGSWESWWADADRFPASVIGKDYVRRMGWGEMAGHSPD